MNPSFLHDGFFYAAVALFVVAVVLFVVIWPVRRHRFPTLHVSCDLTIDKRERFYPDWARRGRGDLPVEQGAATRHGKEAQRGAADKASGIAGTGRVKAL